MGYLNIIAIVTGGPDDRCALAAAVALASEANGVVKVLWQPPASNGDLVADALGVLTFSDTLGSQQAKQAKARTAVRVLAEQLAGKHGMALGSGAAGRRIELAQGAETAWLALGREAPLADLVVLGGSLVEAEGFGGGVAAEALMASRTPVLVVRSDRPILGGRAAVFWDGSPSAGRAVRAAIPILTKASHVTIFQDQIGLDACERDAGEPSKLKDELVRRGVAKVSTVDLIDDDEGQALLDAAKADRAHLIVSGAYGHSRLGERLLGGATRTLLGADWNVNHLMAH